jgi:cob(I)alamin adenosyltransferase
MGLLQWLENVQNDLWELKVEICSQREIKSKEMEFDIKEIKVQRGHYNQRGKESGKESQ